MTFPCIAIDPGTYQSAYAVWNGEIVVEHDLCRNDLMLAKLIQLSRAYPTAPCTIELFQAMGMPVGQTVFETAYWVGRMAALWEALMRKRSASRISMVPVFRKMIAVHHCCSGKAGDANISRALRDRFGEKGTKKNPGIFYNVSGLDEWSAVSIAIWLHDKIVEQGGPDAGWQHRFEPFPFPVEPKPSEKKEKKSKLVEK